MARPKQPTNNTINFFGATTDVDLFGVFSIALALCFLAIVGLPIGLVGAHKAKQEGRSPVLSRIGWILNAVALGFFALFVVVLVVVLVVVHSR